VLTRLDETVLQQIALETGGTYVRSVTGDLDLNKIYRENIQPKIEKKELKTQRRKLWIERFQWSIFLALVCLLIEFLIWEKPVRNPAEER
jgi:Ca-activated chloride channel family protein